MQRTENMISKEASEFYKDALQLLNKSRIPYLVGGTFAFRYHTGITRPTKDLDLFCKTGDYTKILSYFKENGYITEIVDARWLAKIAKGDNFIDLIFGSRTEQTPIDNTWFIHAPSTTLLGSKVKVIAAEELIWSKAYVQHRDKYDGVDVNHLILRKGSVIDWKHLLMRLDAHWEILFAHILNFRFVYPSERELVPKWIIEELISRLQHQLTLPTPKDKISRGYLITDQQYDVDTLEWGFRNISTQH